MNAARTNLRANGLVTPILFCLVLAASYFTYYRNYDHPAKIFWDENYHIASAQKYLDGVMFIEPHPPLGKLFIALGERIFHANDRLDRSAFLKTDFLRNDDLPEGYSFRGVRFFPALFGMLGAGLFFLILLEISGNRMTAFLFSALYLFENSLILQSRSAMLDSTQIFFILAATLCFLRLAKRPSLDARHYLCLGLISGLAISVKLNSAVLLLLFPFLFFSQKKSSGFRKPLRLAFKAMLAGLSFLAGISLVFCSVYYVHFALGRRIVPGRTYESSRAYQEIIVSGQETSWRNFPLMLKENLAYSGRYESKVPKFKPDDPNENGSLPITWPFGDKSINYRWEKLDGTVRYLYFQGNPIVWASGLIGLAGGLAIIAYAAASRPREPEKRRLVPIILFFLALYAGYMAAMFRISRVMYLYHYLIPLIFSLFLFYAAIHFLFGRSIRNGDARTIEAISLFIALAIIAYLFFAPFTYYQPLNAAEFHLRQWFGFWHLKPVI